MSNATQRRVNFKEITAELWRIQDEMDSLKTQLWRALHRLGDELEKGDEE
jgi:hypothetical protein